MKLLKRSAPDEISGFLDSGSTLTGELHFSGTFRLEGTLHGSIITPDILVVGPEAKIHADIKAGEVRIHGMVWGNVDCKSRVYIYSTGRLHGDVRTPRLVIEDGGAFEGSSRAAGSSEEEPQSSDSGLRTIES